MSGANACPLTSGIIQQNNTLRIIVQANRLRIVMKANTLRIILQANMLRVMKDARRPSIMKDASTVAYTYSYRNLVTTLNFPCSVRRSISAHWKMSKGEGRKETDVSLSAVKRSTVTKVVTSPIPANRLRVLGVEFRRRHSTVISQSGRCLCIGLSLFL
jgi:hypothetical protein